MARTHKAEAASQRKMQKACDDFNAAHPDGTKVRYWTGIREGEGRPGKVGARAYVLGGHSPVVWIIADDPKAPAGTVALTHVEVIR